MSGLIVSRQAKKPYFIQDIGINIYSVEELSYFLYDYMPIVGSHFFSEELIEYIRNTLGLGSLAERMKELQNRHGSVGDMIMLIAKSSGYYSESELVSLQQLLDVRKGASEIALLKEKGDKLAEIGQHVSAIRTYRDCLKKQETLENKEFSSTIYYQLGCIYSRLLQLDEAEEAFLSALKLKETRTCLQKLYFVYKMQEDTAAAEKMEKDWNLSSGMRKEWDNAYRTALEQAGNDSEDQTLSIEKIKQQYRREHGAGRD